MASFVDYVRTSDDLPVTALSLHNEGEDWTRWHDDGVDHPDLQHHDYNAYWSPQTVAQFMPLLRSFLDQNRMTQVLVSPGEPTNWYRFDKYGYTHALCANPAALQALGLITSHSFACLKTGAWFSDYRSSAMQRIAAHRPGIHSWVTSCSFHNMDAYFGWDMINNIYAAGVNGIIPWALIQNHSLWDNGDPNPGCAISVDGAGGYTIEQGYYVLKHFSRAGRAGMQVVDTSSNDSQVSVVAFGANDTPHRNSCVLVNTSDTHSRSLSLQCDGIQADTARIYRTTREQCWQELTVQKFANNSTELTLPPNSITSCFF
jgi:hypothetical protein